MLNLRSIPKLRDSISYLYVEHAVVEKDQHSLKMIDAGGTVQIPVAGLCALLLGPGTKITHDAVRIAAENGCSLVWTGEEGVRTYACGIGETRKSARTLRQITCWADEEERLRVVISMYMMRFPDPLPAGLTLKQIRGHEGIRMRDAYALSSRKYNVPWLGRSYDRSNWGGGDPVNRALSTANSCLYGIVHAAIVSVGYSPAIGFIHTGKQLSFVYDIADLYKADITIPAAFEAAAGDAQNLERTVRTRIRDIIREKKLLERIVTDMDELFRIRETTESDYDDDAAKPAPYWDPPEEIEKKVLCLS